jgi:hypothetical protein
MENQMNVSEKNFKKFSHLNEGRQGRFHNIASSG